MQEFPNVIFTTRKGIKSYFGVMFGPEVVIAGRIDERCDVIEVKLPNRPWVGYSVIGSKENVGLLQQRAIKSPRGKRRKKKK